MGRLPYDMSQKTKVHNKAIKILESHKRGLRFNELVDSISKSYQDIPKNTIIGYVVSLPKDEDSKVYRPSRGLFKHIKFRENETSPKTTAQRVQPKNEELFYPKIAGYLVGIEECKAEPIGGRLLGDKWGTPDVIGIKRSSNTDPIQFNPEVISVEVKTSIDKRQLIEAFGQACSYRLFSHKVYLFISKTDTNSDGDIDYLERIESLCLIFGLGLVLFNNKNPEKPEFEIKLRATKHEPDYYYVNQKLKIDDEAIKKLID